MGHLNLDLKERHFLIFQVFLFVIPVSIILPPGIFWREFSQTFIEVSFNFKTQNIMTELVWWWSFIENSLLLLFPVFFFFFLNFI